MSRPVIGLTTSTVPEVWNGLGKMTVTNYSTVSDYCRGVEKAGGLPICLPNLSKDVPVSQALDLVDGLIFTGGADVNPLLFGEEPIPQSGTIDMERDRFELDLAKEAFSRKMPVFGICRGVQVIAIAAGGTIFQDIHAQAEAKIKHRQVVTGRLATHSVNAAKGSLMEKILGGSRVTVNSYHHQAARDLPENYAASVKSDDGIIEGIEKKGDHFVAGVQWHPELLLEDIVSINIFKAIVEASSKK